MLRLFTPWIRIAHLTPLICVDVLLAADEEPSVKGGEDETVVTRLPEELDVGGVGHSGHWDAVGVFGGGAERLRHLLLTYTPVGGHEGHPAKEQGGKRLDEGEARGTHLLQERHRVRTKHGLRFKRENSDKTNKQAKYRKWGMKPLPWRVSGRRGKRAAAAKGQLSSSKARTKSRTTFFLIQVGNSHPVPFVLQQPASDRRGRSSLPHTPSSLIHPYKAKTHKSVPSASILIPRLILISPLPCFPVQMFTAANICHTG